MQAPEFLSFIWDVICTTPLSTYPPGIWTSRPSCPKANPDLFGLSTPEVFPRIHRWIRRELLPHGFTLIQPKPDGLVSVALSVIWEFLLKLLPVRKQDALCCPDFPPFWRIRKAIEPSTMIKNISFGKDSKSIRMSFRFKGKQTGLNFGLVGADPILQSSAF